MGLRKEANYSRGIKNRQQPYFLSFFSFWKNGKMSVFLKFSNREKFMAERFHQSYTFGGVTADTDGNFIIIQKRKFQYQTYFLFFNGNLFVVV